MSLNGTAGAELYDEFTFSCVVDSSFKLQMQAQILVASLVKLAGVPGQNIIVHAVAGLDPDFTSWLQSLGVVVEPVQPFAGHRYCNKLAQLGTPSAAGRPFIVMMDCDTAATGPIRWPRPRRVSAKRVDTAAPPQTFLANIFAAAQLGEPQWVDSDFLPGPEDRRTDRNNCNGGVYVIERSFLAVLAPVWRRWARWCIENRTLFGPYDAHIDQVSLAMAARELNIEIEPLDRACNMPTHLGLAPEFDLDAQVLHYHGHIDERLLLRATGLPRVDAAIRRVNECLEDVRRGAFLNSIFFGARYEVFPQLGSGVGSQGGNLEYKRRLLRELVRDSSQSVIDIGCGDLAVSSSLPVREYVGIDIAASAIEAARRLRPDWEFLAGNAAEFPLTPRDVVICLDVLIHQPTYAQYRKLAEHLCELTRDTLIVGAYDCDPAFTSPITFYYEPITRTLAECGEFSEVSVVGRYRDICVVAARKRRSPPHRRDLPAREFNTMSTVTDYPLLLRLLVDEARSKMGFFPAHTPRALEYPWVLANLPGELEGKAVLDVGAGVNPLPFMLADRGAAAFTIDSHPEIRDLADRRSWNEWGFLDYSQLDSRITSVRSSYEGWTAPRIFDCIYSVSVIEHLLAEIRRLWIANFARQLNSGGLLLLTADLVPETDRLWNFSEGSMVESEELHGTMGSLAEELQAAGFAIDERYIKRNIPGTRVDVGFLRARLWLRPSIASSGLPCRTGFVFHNLDRVNGVTAPSASEGMRAAAGADITFEGWAVDSKAKAPAAGVEIVVDGVPYAADYRLERRDVAGHFRRPEYLASGFALRVPGALLGKGPHEFKIRVISAAADAYWEGNALLVKCGL